MAKHPRSFQKKTQDILGYLALFLFASVVKGLPEKRALSIGERLGSFASKLVPKYKKVVQDNLRKVFGDAWSEEVRQRVANRVFEFQGKNFVEFLLLSRFTEKQICEKIEIHNEHYLDGALGKGKGILLVSAHLGNWELGAAYFAAKGYPIREVVRPISNPFVEAFISNIKEKKGLNLLHRHAANTGEYLRCLRENKILVLATDQYSGPVGVLVPFLGHPSWTVCSYQILARRTGASVVPVFCVQENGGPLRYSLFVEEPISLTFEGKRDQYLAHNARTVNQIIEKYIYKHPEQWFWMHQRWRD